MKRSNMALILLTAAFTWTGCQKNEEASHIKVTQVEHTPVKRQAIGNCWLYAQSTWLESLLKITSGQDINVSETYWTYWDLYEKLLLKQPVPEEELNTGGTWSRSASIIRQYGWVEEDQFIASEQLQNMSQAQSCAQTSIMKQGKEGGTLHDVNLRTPEYVRAELDKAFSCNGTLQFNMEDARARSHKADETLLKDPKTGEERSLTAWLNAWKEVRSPGYTAWGQYEGKKLATVNETAGFKQIEQRIKKALNDHQPVVISFLVSFNAPDSEGVFNLNTLAEVGNMGRNGGHMVVLHDYAVNGPITLGEGDMAPELKEAALLANLEYLVVKNSWGFDRPDRPWLKNGFSRITWDYLHNRYYDEESGLFRPFLRSVVLPPGY